MEVLNINQKNACLGGKKIKNNAIFAIGLATVVVSNLINDIFDYAANKILSDKGIQRDFNYSTPYMKIGTNANNSSILF